MDSTKDIHLGQKVIHSIDASSSSSDIWYYDVRLTLSFLFDQAFRRQLGSYHVESISNSLYITGWLLALNSDALEHHTDISIMLLEFNDAHQSKNFNLEQEKNDSILWMRW